MPKPVSSPVAALLRAVAQAFTFRSALFRSREFRQYLCGHLCVLLAAAVTGMTGSMLPLALGASASLVLTVPLLKRLRGPASRRR